VLTGVACLGIALTPGYRDAGIIGPILLILFRIMQGIGIGGDYGGAITWIGEFAHKSKWRGFWGSWIGVSINTGILVSSLSFFVMVTTVSRQDFLNWGWRILFGLGALAAVVGIVIRYKLAESPLFAELRAKKQVETAPLFRAAKKYWRKLILTAVPYGVVYAVANITVNVYGQAYLAGLRYPVPLITLAVAAVAIISIFFSLIGGTISDVFPRGRKWVIIILMSIAAIFSIFVFPMYNTLNFLIITLGMTLTFGLMNATTGVFPGLFVDQYRTSERYSGAGFGSQLGALVTGVFLTPILPIVLSMYKTPFEAWPGVAVLLIIALIIGIGSLLAFREKRPADLAAVE
jgi:MFS family permease